MPIYTYQCHNCQRLMEVIQPITATLFRHTLCTSCDSAASLVITPTNFQLKGSGWTPKSS
jgi:putative FmdB family regulatory protein